MDDKTELRQVVKQSQDSNSCLPNFKSHAHLSTTTDMILSTVKERGENWWSIRYPKAVMSIPARTGCPSLGRLPL